MLGGTTYVIIYWNSDDIHFNNSGTMTIYSGNKNVEIRFDKENNRNMTVSEYGIYTIKNLTFLETIVNFEQ